MNFLRSALAAALVAMLLGCSTSFIRPNYAASDAGTVVIAFGASSGTAYSEYIFRFRAVQASGNATEVAHGTFVWFQTNIFGRRPPDFQSEQELGNVLVRKLPPGEYEIHDFQINHRSLGAGEASFSSRRPFSIRFSVRSNETTYLGNYQANAVGGSSLLGFPVLAGAVFAVSDRKDAEVELARNRGESIPGTVVNSTPDPRTIGSPSFVRPPAR